MRERFNVIGYDYGKTMYRNIYDNIATTNMQGAKAKKIIHMMAKKVPNWEVPSNKYVTVESTDNEGRTTTTQVLQPILGTERNLLGAINVAPQVHSKVNTHRPSCKFSFICTLSRESGVLTSEELQLLIDHKTGYVKNTSRGRTMVQQYHRLGSVLERHMQADLNRYWLYNTLYDRWLKNIVKYVRDGEYDNAEDSYLDMLKYLCRRYNVRYPYDRR